MNEQIKQIENKFQQLNLVPYTSDKRKFWAVWTFVNPNFDVLLNRTSGKLIVNDTEYPYQCLGITIEQNKWPVKYYDSVDTFIKGFSYDELSYLKRRKATV